MFLTFGTVRLSSFLFFFSLDFYGNICRLWWSGGKMLFMSWCMRSVNFVGWSRPWLWWDTWELIKNPKPNQLDEKNLKGSRIRKKRGFHLGRRKIQWLVSEIDFDWYDFWYIDLDIMLSELIDVDLKDFFCSSVFLSNFLKFIWVPGFHIIFDIL